MIIYDNNILKSEHIILFFPISLKRITVQPTFQCRKPLVSLIPLLILLPTFNPSECPGGPT